MINHAKFPEYDFLAAWALMDEYYPLMMDKDTFLEKAWYGWKQIGNKYSYLHVYEADIPNDGIVEIPDNVESIEVVTTNEYFYNTYLGNSKYESIFFYRDGSLLKKIADLDKPVFQNELVNRLGAFINYELHGSNILHFDKEFAGSEICIVYSGIISDEDCNPMITYKEAEAIAHYVAHVDTRRKAFMGDKNAAALIQMTKKESDIAIAAARIPEQLNENLMDQVFNIKTSFDRKSYNRNLKHRK